MKVTARERASVAIERWHGAVEAGESTDLEDFMAEAVAEAMADARRSERERCAKLADEQAAHYRQLSVDNPGSAQTFECSAIACDVVGELIRDEGYQPGDVTALVSR